MSQCILSPIRKFFATPIFTIRNSRREDVEQIACLLEKLRCSNKQLRMYKEFWDNVGSALLLVNSDTEMILDANPVACALYGYHREDMLKKKITELSDEPECTQTGMFERAKHIPFRWHKKRGNIRFPVQADVTYFNDQGYTVCAVIIKELQIDREIEVA